MRSEAWREKQVEFISHIVGCLSGRVLWAADSAAREREIWKPPARRWLVEL